MYTLLAGVACKIFLNFTLIGIPGVNIHGAPIASLVCYTVSMVPNLYYVVRYAAGKMPWKDMLLRPLAATLPMGAAVWALWRFVFTDRYLYMGRARLLLAVTACVGAGIAVYAVLAMLTGALRREDLPARLRRGRGERKQG